MSALANFIEANPVASSVIFVALICIGAFLWFSYDWAARPTIVQPSDFGEEGEQ